MTRGRSLLAVVLVLLCVVALAPTPAGAGESRTARKVLVISVPALRWADLADHRLPALEGLARRSAVASMSVRTLGPVTLPAEGYATIGAGNRAGPGSPARGGGGLALDAADPVENGTARDAMVRRCGCRVGDSSVVHLEVPAIVETNHQLLYGAEVGSLGHALHAAGLRTAVVGNADRTATPNPLTDDYRRSVALMAADEQGLVDGGHVGDDLLRRDRGAAFGLRLDPGKTLDAAAQAWAATDLLVVEASDLARADALRVDATSVAADRIWARALADTDRLVAGLLELVDPAKDLVLLVGPTSPSTAAGTVPPAELSVATITGPGIKAGLARSATTRRAGYVTLPDVGPTVLQALGVAVPTAMNGTAITSAGGHAPGFAELADGNELTVFRDRATGPVSVTFIVFQVLVYLATILALSRVPRLRRWLVPLALITLAQPSLVFLSRLFPYDALGVPGYIATLFLLGGVLAALAILAGRALSSRLGRAAILVPPLLLVGLLVVVLVVDVLAGAPLQLDTVFGYSPTVAGRFSGYGNLAFGMLAAAALVLASGLWGARVLRGRKAPTTAVLVLLGVVVIADGFPSWGADVGGVLALVPAGIVLGLLLAGRRVDLRRSVVIGAVTGGVLAAFAFADLARPEDKRTHLGRLAARLLGGDSGAGTVLQRKLQANISILTSSVWTWIIPVAVIFLTFLLRRRPGRLQFVEERIPGLRPGLVAALVAGGLGFALNDSGVAIPAVMLAVVLPYLAYLVLVLADEP